MKSFYLKVMTIFIFLFPAFTEGYSGEGKNHLNIGAGWAHMGLRDKGVSPLYYSGSHLFFSSGFKHRTDILLNYLEVNFLYGSITPAIYPGLTTSQMQSFRTGVSFSHMRFVGNIFGSKGKFFLGGIIGSQFSYYEHNQFANSAKNNYSISTISLSSSLSHPLSANEKKYNLALQLYVPVIAFIIRPNYSYIQPEGFLDHNAGNLQNLFNSIEVSSLKKFFGLGSELSFKYRLKSSNAIKISYRWEYSGHNNINQLKTATHGILLQTIF